MSEMGGGEKKGKGEKTPAENERRKKKGGLSR